VKLAAVIVSDYEKRKISVDEMLLKLYTDMARRKSGIMETVI